MDKDLSPRTRIFQLEKALFGVGEDQGLSARLEQTRIFRSHRRSGSFSSVEQAKLGDLSTRQGSIRSRRRAGSIRGQRRSGSFSSTIFHLDDLSARQGSIQSREGSIRSSRRLYLESTRIFESSASTILQLEKVPSPRQGSFITDESYSRGRFALIRFDSIRNESKHVIRPIFTCENQLLTFSFQVNSFQIKRSSFRSLSEAPPT